MSKVVMTFARISVVTIMVATLLAAAIVVYARSQGSVIYSVQTGSMRPAINPGDAILVRQNPDSLMVGDVVSYRSLEQPDIIITHRITSIDQQRNLLTTKGDALSKPDPSFSPDRVVGVVTDAVPLAGYALNFIRHPAGLIAAVYVPAIVLSVWEIRRLMRYYARQHYQLYYY